MSNEQYKLSGLNPLAYMGTEASTPAQQTLQRRDPTANDYNFILGTEWLNKTDESCWKLVHKQHTLNPITGNIDRVATWVKTAPAGSSYFTTDNGYAYPADDGNVNVLGGTNMHTEAVAPAGDTITVNVIDHPTLAGGLTITPLAGPGVVLTDPVGLFQSSTGTDGQIFVTRPAGPVWVDLVSADASVVITESVDPLHPGGINLKAIGGGGGGITKLEGDDTLTVTPDIVTGIIKVLGDDTIKTFRSALDTLKVGIEDSPLNGDIIIGGGAGVASAWGTITSSDLSVTITHPGPNTINLTVAGGAGGFGGLKDSAAVIAAPDVAHCVTVTAALPMTTTTAGSTVTVNHNAPNLDGRLLISSAGGAATWRTLTAGANVTITQANDGAGQIIISSAGGGAGGGIQQIDCDSGVAVNPVTNIIRLEGYHGTYNIDHTTHPYQNIFTSSAGGTPDLVSLRLTSSIQLPVTNAGGTAGVIMLGANDFMHAYGTNNTFLGSSAGNRTFVTATSHENVGIGTSVLGAIVQSGHNTVVGYAAAHSLTGTGASSTASYNTIVGRNALGSATLSKYNLILGANSGSSYTTGESSNILLMSSGNAAESNTIRIGTSGTGDGQQSDAFMAGIYGKFPVGGVHLSHCNPVFVENQNTGDKLVTIVPTQTGQVLISGDPAVANSFPAWARLASANGSIAFTYAANSVDIHQGNTCSFSAYLAAPQTNVTGDGTEYFLGTLGGAGSILTESYDENVTFYPGNGIALPAKFTAPTNGFYCLNMQIYSWYVVPPPPPTPPAVTPIDPLYIRIYNAAGVLQKTYELSYPLYSLMPANQTASYTAHVVMNATDYATFSVSAILSTGTKIMGVGAGIGNTYVSGYRIKII